MLEQLHRGEEASTEQSLAALECFPSQEEVSLPDTCAIALLASNTVSESCQFAVGLQLSRQTGGDSQTSVTSMVVSKGMGGLQHPGVGAVPWEGLGDAGVAARQWRWKEGEDFQ